MIVKQELFTMSHDWKDVGNVQVPLGMNYVEQVGLNPSGNGHDLGSPEAIHLDKTMLPSHEHYFLNKVGTCYHAFANSAHKFMLWWQDVELTSGVYKLELEYTGDYVNAGTDKPPVSDQYHTEIELSIGKAKHIVYANRNGSDTASIQQVIDSDGLFNVGIFIYVKWPKSSDMWANGMFIKSITLTKLNTVYEVRVVKVAQEANEDTLSKVMDYVHIRRRTFTFSTDDCVKLMQNVQANKNSCVEIVDKDDPSQQGTISVLEALGIKWEELNM